MARPKTLSDAIDQTIDNSEAPFEMANLFPKHTGLPFVVWISYKGGAQHDVRVKVSLGPKAHPSEVGQALSPANLVLLAKWIGLNHDVLMKYWEGDIDTKDAVEAIQPIE